LERIIALRKKVDEIDEKILYFIKERVETSKSIGAVKREHGISIKDYQREDEVYTSIIRKASELGLDLREVRAIYRKIIAMSVHAQECGTKT